MIYNWDIENKNKKNKDLGLFAKILNTDESIVRILLNRGIDTIEEMKSFLNPNEKDFYDPFLMKGMKETVLRIREAIEKKEKILIFGDYDVDGITSTAMLYKFFQTLGIETYYFIPHRLEEGYGLSINGIDYALSKNVKLIITVDCGTTAYNEIEYAVKKNIDVIVTDHHEFGERIPYAISILNPNSDNETYPFKSLAGCGVTFKLIQALVKFLNLDISVVENFIDFVTLGTIADVVPLVGENRTISFLGLKHLKQVKNFGIRSLISTSGLDFEKLTSYHIGYILAPRINAMGRMDDPLKALQLLLTENQREAENLAYELNSKNRLRQEVDQDVYEEAIEIIEKDNLDKNMTIVVAKENWHEGVIGIVASRLVEKYNKPTIMISIVDDIGKGSGRSTQNFHLYDALKSLENELISFGGHRLAAGITLKKDRIEDFKRKFEEYAIKKIGGAGYQKDLKIDCEIDLDRIDLKFYQEIEKLEPFGFRNPSPVFISRNVNVFGYPIVLKDKHLRIAFKQDTKIFDAIWFNNGKELIPELVKQDKRFDIVFNVAKNFYNEKVVLQLKLIDIDEAKNG